MSKDEPGNSGAIPRLENKINTGQLIPWVVGFVLAAIGAIIFVYAEYDDLRDRISNLERSNGGLDAASVASELVANHLDEIRNTVGGEPSATLENSEFEERVKEIVLRAITEDPEKFRGPQGYPGDGRVRFIVYPLREPDFKVVKVDRLPLRRGDKETFLVRKDVTFGDCDIGNPAKRVLHFQAPSAITERGICNANFGLIEAKHDDLLAIQDISSKFRFEHPILEQRIDVGGQYAGNEFPLHWTFENGVGGPPVEVEMVPGDIVRVFDRTGKSLSFRFMRYYMRKHGLSARFELSQVILEME